MRHGFANDIYPGPVGVDIKCSMSLLQFDLPADQIIDKPVRRQLIDAVCNRIPTGAGRGQRHAKKARRVATDLGRELLANGATPSVCNALGIPAEWAERCEDSAHRGHDDTAEALAARLDMLLSQDALRNFLKRSCNWVLTAEATTSANAKLCRSLILREREPLRQSSA